MFILLITVCWLLEAVGTLNTYPSDSHRLLTHILRSAGTKNSYLWTTIPAIIPLLTPYPHPKVKHIIEQCCWLNFSCLVIVSWPPSMRITHFQRNEASNSNLHFDGIYASRGNGKLTLTWTCHEKSPWKSKKIPRLHPCMFFHHVYATLKLGKSHGIPTWYPDDLCGGCITWKPHPRPLQMINAPFFMRTSQCLMVTYPYV